MNTQQLKNYILVTLVIVVSIALLIGVKNGSFDNLFSTQESNQGVNQPGSNNQENIDTELYSESDPVKGSADAPITIVEFSDFECPFCKRFYDQTLSQIEKNYVETGKAKIVYRDFPLERIHPTAKTASLAAECAKEQGKFWEYHDKIFDNQNQLSKTSLKEWAEEIGLNTESFNQCLNNKKYENEVLEDLSAGRNLGVQGTPHFIIRSSEGETTSLSGAQPYSRFETVLEQYSS